MKLYHGTDLIVDNPKIISANRPLDFGDGFYLNTSYEQAKKWALSVKTRNNSNTCYVNLYTIDLDKCLNELTVIKFDSANKDWLEFVCNNRKGIISSSYYDMAIGPVADDSAYSLITRYENGVYDLQETLKRLKVEILKDQILFHTEKSLKYLTFEGVEEIYD